MTEASTEGWASTTEHVECDAKIRPFPERDMELCCSGIHERPDKHMAVLHDYAYVGSKTALHWVEGDRRNYHGDWPGECQLSLGCMLPAGHRGSCA